MKFSFVTLFPNLLEPYFKDSILKKAVEKDLINYGEEIITAETEVCQQKERGVRGLLKSTTEKVTSFTVTKTSRYC